MNTFCISWPLILCKSYAFFLKKKKRKVNFTFFFKVKGKKKKKDGILTLTNAELNFCITIRLLALFLSNRYSIHCTATKLLLEDYVLHPSEPYMLFPFSECKAVQIFFSWYYFIVQVTIIKECGYRLQISGDKISSL